MSRSPQITLPQEQEEHPWRTIALIIALFAAMLIIAYGITTVTAPVVNTDLVVGAEGANIAENPELNLYRRYLRAATAHAEMSFLANNPEIMFTQRYRELQATNKEARFLAQNPEVRLARRYAAQFGSSASHSFLAQNPEIRLFQRFAGQE